MDVQVSKNVLIPIPLQCQLDGIINKMSVLVLEFARENPYKDNVV